MTTPAVLPPRFLSPREHDHPLSAHAESSRIHRKDTKNTTKKITFSHFLPITENQHRQQGNTKSSSDHPSEQRTKFINPPLETEANAGSIRPQHTESSSPDHKMKEFPKRCRSRETRRHTRTRRAAHTPFGPHATRGRDRPPPESRLFQSPLMCDLYHNRIKCAENPLNRHAGGHQYCKPLGRPRG